MRFDILTIFPMVVETYANESILGRAQKKKLIKIKAHNFREYSKDKHRRVDDTPYGGGAGMVLQVQPIYDCLKKLKMTNSFTLDFWTFFGLIAQGMLFLSILDSVVGHREI